MKKLYAVICQFRGGWWGIADFWGVPYSSASFHEAHDFRRAILKAKGKHFYWTPDKFKVVRFVQEIKTKQA